MIQVKQIPVGLFEMNCYVVSVPGQKECLIIDPGDDPPKIISYIEQNDLVPERILMTHCHIDHVRYSSQIQNNFNIPLFCGEADLPLLEGMNEQAALFGLEKTELPRVDGFLSDGQTFSVANLEGTLWHTPGHSPGSFCLHIEEHLFVGDVLFLDSIGRTDLYGGSYPQLIQSIREKLLVLDADTIVYPGHGPTTTIGRENKQNPFLNQS